jgi:hypothetical protein
MSQEQSPQPTPEEAYELNYAAILDFMGRINARLAAKRRVEKPRDWDHVGEQEEVIAMLRSVAEFLGA